MEAKIAEKIQQVLCQAHCTDNVIAKCTYKGCATRFQGERIAALIAADRAEHDKHFNWVAEHLTRLRIGMTGEWMEIEYLGTDGQPEEIRHQDPDCEESYPEMLHKAIDSALKEMGK